MTNQERKFNVAKNAVDAGLWDNDTALAFCECELSEEALVEWERLADEVFKR